MAVTKITEKTVASALKDGAHFLVTQPETVDGSPTEALRRVPISMVREDLEGQMEETYAKKTVTDTLTEDVSTLNSAIADTDETFSDFIESEIGVTTYVFHYDGNKAWNTGNDPVELKVPNITTWKYCKIPCVPGDVFHVNISLANSSYRPWAFVTSTFEKIIEASGNTVNENITAPSNAAYLLCNVRIMNSDAVYEVIKGTNRIDGIESAVGNISTKIIPDISELTSNLFDDSQLDEATGITKVSAHEYTGTASAFIDNGNLTFDEPFAASTQYTLSASAYDSTTGGTSSGLTLKVTYTDESVERLAWSRSTNTYARKSLTTESGKTVASIAIAYNNGPNDVWFIKDIMITKGTDDVPFYRYGHTAVDAVARKGKKLDSTGDTTDRTAEIQQMLNSGDCALGPGVFYTSGVTLPDGATLTGCGRATQLILAGSGSGNCVTMGKLCTVKNLEISGSVSDITVPETVGNRNGIYCGGTGGSSDAWKGVIDGCYIHGFTGCGINLYRIGQGSAGGVSVSNCYCYNCCVGLLVGERSEFCHISNSTMSNNYYGCQNNGGNNWFSCCSFTKNSYGFVMGDTAGTDYQNNSHGGASVCTFPHNSERAIYMNNMRSGFAFTGCMISAAEDKSGSTTVYNDAVEIVGSYPVIFSGCYSMDQTTYIIRQRPGTTQYHSTVLFDGMTFRDNAVFKTDDDDVGITKIHFDGCYTHTGSTFTPNIVKQYTPT